VAVVFACGVAVLVAPGVRWIAWAAASWPLLDIICNFIDLPHPVWMDIIGARSPHAAALRAQRFAFRRWLHAMHLFCDSDCIARVKLRINLVETADKKSTIHENSDFREPPPK